MQTAHHPAQVAGTFYPDDNVTLRQWIARAAQLAVAPCIDPKIVVVPHAGLRFCAHVAASAIAPLVSRRSEIARIVIIGPAHRFGFEGLALHPARQWQTPLGMVQVADMSAMARHARVLPEAFAGEHSIELPLVMLQGMLGDGFEILPVLVGRCETAQVVAALRAIWGGPETVIVVSSDLSHFHPLDTAAAMDRATAAKIERFDPQIGAADACGFRPLSAVVALAAERDMRPTTLHLTTSAEATGDGASVVGYGAFGFEYAASAHLPEAHRDLLLRLLKVGLERAVESGGVVPKLHIEGRLPPTLSTRRATFVTLKKGGQLRGCIGQVSPQQPLIDDALTHAVKAGFRDPRFGPLTRDELPDLDISVSILSHPRPVVAGSEDELAALLEPDRDGLILGDQGRGALFLPSVWEAIHEPRAFIRQLKQKAGLAPDHWSASMSARRFRTESFGSAWADIGPLQGVQPESQAK